MIDLGVDIGGLKTRAEMLLEFEDFIADMADGSGVPEHHDGGCGPNSHFAHAMRKDD